MTVPSPAGPEALFASRALAESLPGAGVLVLDTDLRILYAEGNLFLRLGIDARAVEGTLLQDWAGPTGGLRSPPTTTPRSRASLSRSSSGTGYRDLLDRDHPGLRPDGTSSLWSCSRT